MARAWPLLGAGAVVELLALSGVLPARPDLVHAISLPPLDLTFDLGALLGRATGPAWFAFGLVLAITGRATILSLMLGSLRRWWFALRFELVVLVPSFLAAELAYCGQAVLYSALFWVGVVLAVAWTVVFAHVPWRGSSSVLSTIGSGLRDGPRLPTVLSYLAALGVLGALVRGGGKAPPLIGVGVSVLLTVAAARRLSRPPTAPMATRLAVVVLAAVLVALSLTNTSVSVPHSAQRPGELVVVAGMDTSSGHGSLFSLRPSYLGFSCERTRYYSYAGPGPGAPQAQAACPITTGSRYTRVDTERPLPELVSSFRAQVDRLAPPVTVITHSSGAWVAWAAVSGDRATPVRRIVMLAPLSDPHGYPPPGTNAGGTVGAAGMRLVVAIANWEGFSHFDPDRPLATALLGSPRAARALLERPLQRQVQALAVPSAYDLVLFSTSNPFGRAQAACALFQSHGAVSTSAAAAADADRFLSGRLQLPCARWPSWAADAASGFQVP